MMNERNFTQCAFFNLTSLINRAVFPAVLLAMLGFGALSKIRFRRRFVAALIFSVLLFLAGRAFAETNADAPTGKSDAVIDLATRGGVDLVKGEWRYFDSSCLSTNGRIPPWR